MKRRFMDSNIKWYIFLLHFITNYQIESHICSNDITILDRCSSTGSLSSDEALIDTLLHPLAISFALLGLLGEQFVTPPQELFTALKQAVRTANILDGIFSSYVNIATLSRGREQLPIQASHYMPLWNGT